MRILEGVGTLIQLGGLMARLCKMVRSYSIFVFSAHGRRAEHKAGAICHLDLSRRNSGVMVCTSQLLEQCSEMTLVIVSPVRACIRIFVAYEHRPQCVVGAVHRGVALRITPRLVDLLRNNAFFRTATFYRRHATVSCLE